jgi:transaldolase
MEGYFKRVTAYSPTRLWINNVTPAEAGLAMAAGAVGCTQNPTYPYKMLTHPTGAPHALALLDGILKTEKDDNAAQAALQLVLVKEVADAFLPVYRESRGKAGYVTIQADPFHEDVDTILAAARAHCDAAPNIMAKIPAIPAGFEAMKVLLREGRPLLATEVMSVAQARDCAEIYQAACGEMEKPPVMYFAHIPGIFDEYIAGAVKKDGIDVPADFVWQGGVAVAKKINELLRDHHYGIGFCSGGARGLHHFTEMVGADCCVTINWGGTAETLLQQNPPVVQRFARPTPAAVLDTLCRQIPDFRRGYDENGLCPEAYVDYGPVVLFRTNFEDAWAQGLQFIAARRAQIVA